MMHVHLIGIGGTGLSAIARVLLESGYRVSGSDQTLSTLAQDVQSLGAQVFIGHQAENIQGADLVVRSSAISDTNVEVAAALAAGIPVLKRSEFLGRLIADRDSIAIAGTHGKTTTTAMIAYLLTALGEDPSYIIGGVAKDLNSNAHAGQGRSFVIEADEYDRMFLGLHPAIIVLTNLEHDHPDCYPTLEEYRSAFAEFIHQLKPAGVLLACADDLAAQQMVEAVPAGCQAFTYGMHENAAYQARNIQVNENGDTQFELWNNTPGGSKLLTQVNLTLPGIHNIRNATAALAVIHQVGLPLETAAHKMQSFSGTGRRFDILGVVQDITLIDDYAHHPTEIIATLQAARSRFKNRRIWAVWQPHTYSRTQTLLDEYVNSFNEADQVIITEIYASRESPCDFSSNEVVVRMSHPNVRYAAALQDAELLLQSELRAGDVVIVLSAGDAAQISANLLAFLRQKEGLL
jgi:UDP-N-acetylmuramate--alanine ligase